MDSCSKKQKLVRDGRGQKFFSKRYHTGCVPWHKARILRWRSSWYYPRSYPRAVAWIWYSLPSRTLRLVDGLPKFRMKAAKQDFILDSVTCWNPPQYRLVMYIPCRQLLGTSIINSEFEKEDVRRTWIEILAAKSGKKNMEAFNFVHDVHFVSSRKISRPDRVRSAPQSSFDGRPHRNFQLLLASGFQLRTAAHFDPQW